jgi:hypothetical protein
MPKLLGNSKNFQEGFITLSAVFHEILFVLQASWRHANVVLEYSGKHTLTIVMGFMRMLEICSFISKKYLHPPKRFLENR